MKQILRTDFVRLGENEARSKKKKNQVSERKLDFVRGSIS